MSDLDDKTRAEAEAAQRLLEKRRRSFSNVTMESLLGGDDVIDKQSGTADAAKGESILRRWRETKCS